MRRPRIALAALALAVAALGALAAGPETEVRTSLPRGTLMFPALTQTLPQAQRIEILHQGTRLILARAKAVWTLPDHAGYPAMPERVHGLLAALAGLRLMEPRTGDPDQFGQLGLGDPADPAAAAVLVRVLDGAGVPLAAVILGDAATLGDGYVRSPQGSRAWVASGVPAIGSGWRDWVQTALLDILPETVSAMTSQRAGGPLLTFQRQAGEMALTLPADHPALNRYKIGDMTYALSDLHFRDVRAAADVPGAWLGGASLATPAGLTIAARVNEDAGRLWLVLSAQGPGAPALQDRLGGWAFEVDAQKEQALLPTLGDLAAFQAQAAALPAPVSARPRRR